MTNLMTRSTLNEQKPLVIFRIVNNTFSGNLYPLSRSNVLGVRNRIHTYIPF